ncbi:MAG: dihydroflavonol-4-reductase [Pseudonocardiales bacterium]|jgi:dihydroflavonol-4-reductase|nr:dihydroflavonol-4-reductase [Pseudonocardiales bacterium]
MAEHALVTGASGFIGSAVTRQLLAGGDSVTALVEPGADARALDGLDVTIVEGDLRDAAAVRKAVSGCRSVFHVAALYRFWSRHPREFYDINVGGTRNVLAAAQDEGVERVVYTSTVGTLGLDADRPATESDYPDITHLFGSYKRSKYVAEHEVLRAGAEGVPVVLALPTYPIGPGDRAPTPSGRLVVDFLNGRVPGYVDTVLNVVHVDDVARGHLLARDRGATGRSYIFGGENYALQRLLAELAAVSGLAVPRLRVPRSLSLAAAWLSEIVEGRLLRRVPHVPLEGARMATTRMAFDDSRARTELGYSPRPASEAIAESVRWFLENGYVSRRG